MTLAHAVDVVGETATGRIGNRLRQIVGAVVLDGLGGEGPLRVAHRRGPGRFVHHGSVGHVEDAVGELAQLLGHPAAAVRAHRRSLLPPAEAVGSRGSAPGPLHGQADGPALVSEGVAHHHAWLGELLVSLFVHGSIVIVRRSRRRADTENVFSSLLIVGKRVQKTTTRLLQITHFLSSLRRARRDHRIRDPQPR